jgi:hypothetical protein
MGPWAVGCALFKFFSFSYFLTPDRSLKLSQMVANGPTGTTEDKQEREWDHAQPGGAPITMMARVYGLPGAPLVFIFVFVFFLFPTNTGHQMAWTRQGARAKTKGNGSSERPPTTWTTTTMGKGYSFLFLFFFIYTLL